jgi:DNA-binding NarL/FixJ family response regulator
MQSVKPQQRECIWLVATSTLWVAGFKGLFGDPCGIETLTVSLADSFRLEGPQIVLIDSGASSVDGKVREVMVQFRRWAPELRPVVVSHDTREGDSYIEGLIRAGAKGYLTASSSLEEFRACIDNVRDGSIWAPRKVLSRLVMSSAGQPARSFPSQNVQFTPREDQVIGMLVGGKSNLEIGASLGIDSATVKAHLGRIMRKAGVMNRVELSMFALGRRRNDPEERGRHTSLSSKNVLGQPSKAQRRNLPNSKQASH